MRPKKRVAKTFYQKRGLAVPKQEWWPQNAGELRELVLDVGSPLVFLGEGQHVRSASIGERNYDVVRTTKCSQILSVDRESKLVRVETGVRWGDLQAGLAERGLSLERYQLLPALCTVGGLLSRHFHTGKELWNGDLRSGCVALSSVTPATKDYRYIAAPRKATGPDHRYTFIGGEGLLGAILDVTLVAWKPTDSRLFRWNVDVERAIAIYKNAIDLGVHISWAHFENNEFSAAVYGPERVLKSVERELRSSLSKFQVLGRTETTQARAALEEAHPDRRDLASSKRTLTATFSLEHLAAALSSTDAEHVEIWDWSRRHAKAYLRFGRGHTVELPVNPAALALDSKPLADDETIHWPQWAQVMKAELDPDRRLATGP